MSNLAIVQELYEAFETGGIERAFELCAADCVVTQDAALPWGGHYEGLEGVAKFALALATNIDSTITTDALFEAGDQVVQSGRSRGHVIANSVEFDVPEVHVWTIREGKITAAAFYLDTTVMLRALGGAS